MDKGKAALLGAALVAGLTACGGGGDGASVDRSADTPSATTLAAYAAGRSQRVTAPGHPPATDAERTWLFDDSRERAVALVVQALAAADGNALALPALQASFLQTVTAAARGDTLAQVHQRHPGTPPGFYAAMRRTADVERALSAPADARLLPGFLTETDSFGALPPLAGWSVKAWPEEGASSSAPADVRLVVADTLAARGDLPSPQGFDGSFRAPDGRPWRVPMVRLHNRVTQLRGADFVAKAVPVARGVLVQIEPGAELPLPAFARERLSPALSDIARWVDSRIQVGGDMVLPVQAFELAALEASAARLPLAFDPWRADLGGLDGGGTHLRVDARPNRLSIGTSAVELSGGHELRFQRGVGPARGRGARAVPEDGASRDRASEDGASEDGASEDGASPGHASRGGAARGGAWGGVPQAADVRPATPSSPRSCSQGAPDLRPFFLAWLHHDRRVVALAAISVVAGDACG